MAKTPHAHAFKARELKERLEALQDITVELLSPRPLKETLKVIAEKAVDFLVCDAGTIYIKEGEDLFFEVAINRSLEAEFARAKVPTQGLAFYCFQNKVSLSIPDVACIPTGAPYRFDDSVDLHLRYKTRSVLIQPLKNREGEAVGVIQLINRKRSRDERWPADSPEDLASMPRFTAEDEKLLESFAAIVSGVLENARLQQEIRDVFEGFVKASVQAIESRDPITKGHSERVAHLTVELAKKVDHTSSDGLEIFKFSPEQLSEIRYASLLHDFGKIGVKEATLQKEEKLSPYQKLSIRSRLDDFRSAAQIKSLREYIHGLIQEERPPTALELARIEKKVQEFGLKLEDQWKLILSLNEPTVLDEDKTSKLAELTTVHCENCAGHSQSLLSGEEIFSLKVKRGSLTDEERVEIESHVTHTFEFLRKIPWTKDLALVPAIAHGHHERLDGKGYPQKLTEPQIPVQSKIMAVCDIFDALVASDRPYKPSMSPERALDILNDAGKRGQIDPRLVKVFQEARCYEIPEFVALCPEMQKRKKAA